MGDEQTFCQGKRHLGVIRKAAGWQCSCGHFCQQGMQRARALEFQRHTQRITNGSPNGNSTQAISWRVQGLSPANDFFI